MSNWRIYVHQLPDGKKTPLARRGKFPTQTVWESSVLAGGTMFKGSTSMRFGAVAPDTAMPVFGGPKSK